MEEGELAMTGILMNHADQPFFLIDDDGGALKVRRARKVHACDGDGAAHSHKAAQCHGAIEPGEYYLEVLWSAPAYASGNHVCTECAIKFYGEWVRR
jgi:hypothetical protein